MKPGESHQPAPAEESDPLFRALTALRNAPVPDGPSPDTLGRALAAVESAARKRETHLNHWRKIMLAGLKIAAALLAAVSGVYFVSNPFSLGAPVTFAEVAAKLQKAQTLAYTMTNELPDQPKQPPVRLLFKEPGHMRCETLPAGGMVVITDSRDGRFLTLNPATKSAVLLDGKLPGAPKPGSQDIAASTVTNFRKLADKPGEPAGEKRIGDVQAKGFRVVIAPGYETLVWVDPEKRLPIQLEVTTPFGEKQMHGTINDIQLDLVLDDSLFSMDPPAGYTLQKVSLAAPEDKNDDGSPEAALVFLLRAYADHSGGTFPKRIDDWRAYVEALKKMELGKSPEALAVRLANIFARAQVFAMDQKGNTHYNPEGIKLGDAGKILLWRKVKDKETYRAIFGDLHVADVTAAQLPAGEKPQVKP